MVYFFIALNTSDCSVHLMILTIVSIMHLSKSYDPYHCKHNALE